MSSVEARITSSGQMSLPAPVRRRWNARSVVVVDRGDYIVVRPVPTDAVQALKGSLPARSALSAEQMRARERSSEGSSRSDR
jgi:bifunctional DNA-binding transcriptional regulator/antitoxin component of YhaV-PrlF toxin-antitoxin module